MDRTVYEEMFTIEETHWWFISKRNIVLYLIEKLLPKTKTNQEDYEIADIGCGCGATLNALSRRYHVFGMDSSDHAVKFCSEKGLSIQKGELPYDTPCEKNRLDAVLLLDVIEHITNDREAVKEAFALLKSGGILICTVPAYQWLWSMHDEMHHHKRRYSKKDFRRLLELSDAEPIVCGHYNAFLFPLALLERITSKFLRRKQPKAIIPQFPRTLNSILEKIFSLERFILQKVPLPFGLSLIGVIRKRESGTSTRSC